MKSSLLLLDHFDSFTFNIKHALENLGHAITVWSVDECTLVQILNSGFDGIILGPGPGSPHDTTLGAELLRARPSLPILGVCLGHQLLASVFGGNVVRAKEVYHGKRSPVKHWGHPLFKGIESPFQAMRYHSLIVDSLPECFELIAQTGTGEIMAILHKEYPYLGLQFHPDSFLCEGGTKIFENAFYFLQNQSFSYKEKCSPR